MHNRQLRASMQFQGYVYSANAKVDASKVKVTRHMAKYGDPYSEFVLCI